MLVIQCLSVTRVPVDTAISVQTLKVYALLVESERLYNGASLINKVVVIGANVARVVLKA
jgi:hypothetical protein